MRVLSVRNVHQALPQGIRLLQEFGYERASRNGPVLVMPCPVTTEYRRPQERLTWWLERDVNVAFLVYEALWMLAGRNDVLPLTRYVKDFGRYSDDGETLHGAYGHRWRQAFTISNGPMERTDQLVQIARQLREAPDDRRAVLQMWSASMDLGRNGADLPCNAMATFQRNREGALDLTVFCRSNDILWGAYFANAFHFSLLQEYMARWIGCVVGTYSQVSVNYHAYLETLAPLADLPKRLSGLYSIPNKPDDPYADGRVEVTPLPVLSGGDDDVGIIDYQARRVLCAADSGFAAADPRGLSAWFCAAYAVLRAHDLWRTKAAPERFELAQAALAASGMETNDMIVAMTTWLSRRRQLWERRLARAG